MTFNEINNQGAAPIAHHMLQEGAVLTTDDNPDNERMMYQSSVYELVASAKAVQVGHEIDPNMMIGCMIAYEPIYAKTCNPQDYIEMTEANHKRYWYMDVQAKGILPNYIQKYWQRMGWDIDVTEDDLRELAKGKVDYIGFMTPFQRFSLDRHAAFHQAIDYRR